MGKKYLEKIKSIQQLFFIAINNSFLCRRILPLIINNFFYNNEEWYSCYINHCCLFSGVCAVKEVYLVIDIY